MMRLLFLVGVLVWCVTPSAAQEKSSAEAAREASEKAERADSEAEGPKTRGSRIMLPGAGLSAGPPPARARNPTGESSSGAEPATPIPPPPPPPDAAPTPAPKAKRAPGWTDAPTTSPAASPANSTGDMFWSGRIYKNGRIRISVGNETTAGYVEGDPLPGVAVVVDARSPIVEIMEQPSARNGFKSFEFRVKKTNKKPVTLNFHWVVKP